MDSNQSHEMNERLRQKLLKEFGALADSFACLRSDVSPTPDRQLGDRFLLERSLEHSTRQLKQVREVMDAYIKSKQQVCNDDLLKILSVYLPAMNVPGVSVENSYHPAASIVRIQVRILEEDIAPVIKLCSQAIANNIKNSIPELVADGGDQLVPAPLEKQ